MCSNLFVFEKWNESFKKNCNLVFCNLLVYLLNHSNVEQM